MKKKQKWLWLLPFLLLPLWLMFINYVADPANIFRNVSKDIATSIISGNRTFVASGNVEVRDVKYQLIMAMPDDTETVAVGPSLVMCVGKELVGTDSFYNLGVFRADFYDILAQFGVMDIYGKHPQRVIFCVDSFFFDDNMFENESGHIPLMPYADYMLNILNGREADSPETDLISERKNKFEQLFSISYFQASIEYIKTNDSLLFERMGIADEATEMAYFMPDGSRVYAKKFREKDVDDVAKHAEKYNIVRLFSKGQHISDEATDTFEKLINYLRTQGTDVELYLCPLAPSLWNRLDLDEYPVLTEIESYANEIAEKYGLKITGSYNPHILGVTDDKFYDCRHFRREYLGEYFDFMED